MQIAESSSKGIELLPYLWMLCGAFAFAIMGAFAHRLGEVCDWQVVALARSIVPLCVAAFLARSTGATLVLRGSRSLWLRSIAGSVSLVSAFYAFTHLPISEVLTLTNLFPIWVAVLSWPLLKVIPAPDVWIAAATGIVGVVLIQHPHLGDANHASAAAGAALGASFCSGLAMIGLHRLKSLHTWAIVVHFSLVSLLFSGGAFFIFERSLAGKADWSTRTLAMLLCVGLSATVGQFFLTKAFTSGPPARVSVAGLTQVGFGMAFDALLWGQSFGPLTILGTILVVAPTGWLLWRREDEESAAEAVEEA
ncbi:MAG: DMT family transporter [Deltaproteobacteria bacterium]